jgi:type IV secretory pathway TrbL component
MATGLSAYLANKFLDAVGNGTAYSAANVYIKLHTGDPGANGTANAATETTRKEVTFASASAGAIASDAAVTWTNIAGSEDATYFTAWDNLSAGNFLFSGSITGNAYIAGDTYTIPSGSLTASLTVAS